MAWKMSNPFVHLFLRVTPVRSVLLAFLTKVEIYVLCQCCPQLRGSLLEELDVRGFLKQVYFRSPEGFRNLIIENSLLVRGPAILRYLVSDYTNDYSYADDWPSGHIMVIAPTGNEVSEKVSNVRSFLQMEEYESTWTRWPHRATVSLWCLS